MGGLKDMWGGGVVHRTTNKDPKQGTPRIW